MYLIIGVLVYIVTAVAVSRRSYTNGYKKGLAEGKLYGEQKLAERTEAMQWEYESGTSPRWRYSKITGETQERYLKPSSLSQQAIAGTSYSEWRTVKANESKKELANA